MPNPKPTKRVQKIAQKLLARLLEKRAAIAGVPSGHAKLSIDALRTAMQTLLELDRPGLGSDARAVEQSMKNILGGEFGETILSLDEAEHTTRRFIEMIEDDSINRLVETIQMTRRELEKLATEHHDESAQILRTLAEIEPLVQQWNRVVQGVSDNRVLRTIANAKQFYEDHVQRGLDARTVTALAEARQIAQEFNLPATDAGLARLWRWLLLGAPTLQDVVPLVSPVRLYSARSVYGTSQNELDKIGKAELWDFFRPGHIYLDVTLATKQEVNARMGRRRSQKDIRQEAMANFSTIRNLVRVQPGAASRAKIQKELERRGIRTDRNRAAEQEERIADESVRKLVQANPDLFWLGSAESPRTVGEIQDLQEIGKVEAFIEKQGRKSAKAGRAKGDPRPRKLWLDHLTLSEVLEQLRTHPEDIDKTEQAYIQFRVGQVRNVKRATMKKKDAILLGGRDPLSTKERKQIERRARANFKNKVRLPLQRERAQG